MADDPWLPERLRREALVRKGERRVERAAGPLYEALTAIGREAFNSTTGQLDNAVLDDRDPRYTAALDGLLNVIGEIYGTAYEEQANRVADSRNPITAATPARPVLPPSRTEGAIFDHLLSVRNRLVGVPDTVWQQVRAEIETGRRLGESIPKLAARVDAVLSAEGMANWKGRARTIARTETIAAYNAGNHAGTVSMAEQFGVPGDKVVRVWLATLDNVTRVTHADADGQQVTGEEPYSVGADLLMFPGDPSGSAEEVINCRCTEQFLLPGDPDYPGAVPQVDPAAAVLGLNPGYGTPGNLGRILNCTNTTGTFELTMRGEKGLVAAALPAERIPFGGVTPIEFFNRWLIPGDGHPEAVDLPLGASVEDVLGALRRSGGNRAFIIARLKNGGGHIFNAVRRGRSRDWQFWDAQSGDRITNDLLRNVASGDWAIQRSDNLICIDRKGMVQE